MINIADMTILIQKQFFLQIYNSESFKNKDMYLVIILCIRQKCKNAKENDLVNKSKFCKIKLQKTVLVKTQKSCVKTFALKR